MASTKFSYVHVRHWTKKKFLYRVHIYNLLIKRVGYFGERCCVKNDDTTTNPSVEWRAVAGKEGACVWGLCNVSPPTTCTSLNYFALIIIRRMLIRLEYCTYIRFGFARLQNANYRCDPSAVCRLAHLISCLVLLAVCAFVLYRRASRLISIRQ